MTISDGEAVFFIGLWGTEARFPVGRVRKVDLSGDKGDLWG